MARNHIVPRSFLTSIPSIGNSGRLSVARQSEGGGIRTVDGNGELPEARGVLGSSDVSTATLAGA